MPSSRHANERALMRRICHTCGQSIAAGSRCEQHPRTERTRGRAWTNHRDRILLRDAYACQINGPNCTRIATEVDHIIPLAHGGTDEDTNLRSVCTNCHRARQ